MMVGAVIQRFMEKHKIDSNNGNCRMCYYHKHTYKYEYVNEEKHNIVCIYGCGETNPANHSKENNNNETWIKRLEGHVINCKYCEDKVVPHTYNENGVCTVFEYKKPCEHLNVTYKNTNNSSKHSIVCSNSDCEKKNELMSEEHTYENGKCTKCNYCQHLDFLLLQK